MRLMIRADANKMIASGHVRRCLAIADAIAEYNVDVLFVFSDQEAQEIIDGTRYRRIVLGNDYREKDTEIPLMKNLIHKECIDGMLVDSYEVSENYFSELSQCCPIAYIVSMRNVNFPGDLLVNYAQYEKQNFLKDKYAHLDAKGFLLQGERYVPLRKEFMNVVRRPREKIEKVLITTGGTDPDNIAGAILSACLCENKLRNLFYTVVVGEYYQHKDQLQAMAENYPQITLKYNVGKMAELMQEHDVAISAGGTTLFETCACGIPTIAFSMADNQIPLVKYFEDKGLIPYVGDVRDNKEIVVENIKHRVCDCFFDPEKLCYLSVKMQKLIDGMGSNRIAEKLIDMIKE